MSEAAVANLSLARLVKIEQRVVGSEHAAMRARWESGHDPTNGAVVSLASLLRWLLAEADSSEQSP